MQSSDIISFWFNEIPSSSWWKKDPQFDQLIKDRFSSIHESARQGELWQWRDSAQGRLAEIIILDQFSRNMFRDDPRAFAQDPLAVALTQEAVRTGADQQLESSMRSFLYMPLMHSESLKVHDMAMELFASLDSPNNLDFEKRHRAIIERFGRYPHRNKVLGRESSPEEVEFLTQPGSSF